MNITITTANPQDAAAILRCLARAFEPYRASYTPGAFADTVLDSATLQSRFTLMSILTARTDDGTVIGTLAYAANSPEEGHLRGMAVLPEFQGNRAAEMLLSRAESDLKSQNCKFISLDTTAPLQRAMSFYERHGYRRSGKVSDFFGMPLYEYVKQIYICGCRFRDFRSRLPSTPDLPLQLNSGRCTRIDFERCVECRTRLVARS